MKRATSLNWDLEIQTWKSNAMIQIGVEVIVPDIIVKIRDPNGKPTIGVAKCGLVSLLVR
jgi:hypothetical protein